MTSIHTGFTIYSFLLVTKMDVLTSFIFCSCLWQMRDVTYWCLVTVSVNMMILLAEGIRTLRNYVTLRNYTRTSVAYITYTFRIHKIRVHTLHTLCTLCEHSHLRSAVHIASADRYRSLRILHHAVAQTVGCSPACQQWSPGFILYLCVWDKFWKKWNWGRLFYE